jgi:amino acid transporter
VRRLNVYGGTAIAISMVVGSGLFGLPGLAIGATDHITALAAWVIVALCMVPIIHIFSVLGAREASAEGVAGYAASAIGNWSRGGFSMIACGALAVGMPAFFLVVGAYTAELFNLNPSVWRGPIGIAFAWASTLLNLRGVQNMGAVNQLIVMFVIVMMVGIIGVTAPGLGSQSAQLSRDLFTHDWDFAALWTACVIVFWAFQGWENLSFGLGEFENPKRTIPRVFWLSFLLVGGLYLSFAWVVSASHYSGIIVSGLSGISALLSGGWARTVLLATMVVVLFANANSWVFGASRAFYSAADLGMLPRACASTDNSGTPVWALIGAATLYTAIIAVIEFTGVHESTAFIITTQGFIILYGFSIISYVRYNIRAVSAWLIALLALAGWLFLMHGFDWLLLYPLALFVVGAVRTRWSGATRQHFPTHTLASDRDA